MALLSVLLSFVYVLLLLLVALLTFLWIIGKLKALRLQNQHDQRQPLPPHYSSNPQPSPSTTPLRPRRLSFSSAATASTATPTITPKRRVTFSLTPEQHANELLKTAVRRRESLPSINLLLSNHSPPTQYNPQPQQVIHLFPPHDSPNFSYNPPQPRPVFPPFQQQPFLVPQHDQPQQKTLNPPSPAQHKRKTSPNKHQIPLPTRQRNPIKAGSRPSSAPVYAADLRRELEQPEQQIYNSRDTQLERSQRHEGDPVSRQRTKGELPTDELPTKVNPNTSDFHALNAIVKEEPGLKRRRTPPSDKKPPIPPRLGAIPNGFAPQQRSTFPRDGVTGIRRNGVVSRPVR